VDALLVGLALVAGGAALVWVSWAGSQGSLRPNGIVGLHLPATRRSDAAWYAGHQAAAGPLGVGGGVLLACGAGVVFTGFDVIGQGLALVALAAALTAIALATVAALRAARNA